MPENFCLSLGGIRFSLIPDRKNGEYSLIRRVSDFIAPGEPDITLKIQCGWFPHLNLENQSFSSNNHVWNGYEVEGKRIIKVSSPHQENYQLGIFPEDFRSGEIFVSQSPDNPNAYIFPFSYPMGELYTMHLMGTGLGVLFHASGIIYQGHGYLFSGHGGVGKTTIARLFSTHPGTLVVNDDKVLVRKEPGGFRMYGTPWHGDGGWASPRSAPLKRVFILKQSGENYVRSLKAVEAVGLMLARTFTTLWDNEKIAFNIKFLEALTQSVPCQELGFLPDVSIIDHIFNLG
jgi:hypothetical protein